MRSKYRQEPPSQGRLLGIGITSPRFTRQPITAQRGADDISSKLRELRQWDESERTTEHGLRLRSNNGWRKWGMDEWVVICMNEL
jgi:hypothetical protein